jgi:type I restriction enzyme S subunit
MVSPAYVVARPSKPVSTTFIEALLRTPNAIEEMRRRSHGVTDFRLRLYWEEFKDIVVALPTPEEMDQIMLSISSQLARYDGLAEASANLVNLLYERRSALISAAVTGKIDVSSPTEADTEAA